MCNLKSKSHVFKTVMGIRFFHANGFLTLQPIFRFAFANLYNSDDLPLMSQNDADNHVSLYIYISFLILLWIIGNPCIISQNYLFLSLSFLSKSSPLIALYALMFTQKACLKQFIGTIIYQSMRSDYFLTKRLKSQELLTGIREK